MHKEARSPKCPRSISAQRADEIVWEKICEAIENPEFLFGQAREYVAKLRENAENMNNDRERLQKEIDALPVARQWTIEQARLGRITSADMQLELSTFTMQEINLKRELASLAYTISLNALNNWEEKVTEYLLDLQAGIQGLKNVAPQKDEERREIFRLKKRIVNTLVERVNIDENRELTVRIRLNLLDVTEAGPDSGAVHLGEFGIYSRRQSSHAHRHHCAVCG